MNNNYSFNINSGDINQFKLIVDASIDSRKSASKEGILYVIIDPQNPTTIRLTKDKEAGEKYGKMEDITKIVDTITQKLIRENFPQEQTETKKKKINLLSTIKSKIPLLFKSVGRKRYREAESEETEEAPANNEGSSANETGPSAKRARICEEKTPIPIPVQEANMQTEEDTLISHNPMDEIGKIMSKLHPKRNYVVLPLDQFPMDIIPLIAMITDEEKFHINQALINFFRLSYKEVLFSPDSIKNDCSRLMPWFQLLPLFQLKQFFAMADSAGVPLMHSPGIVHMLLDHAKAGSLDFEKVMNLLMILNDDSKTPLLDNMLLSIIDNPQYFEIIKQLANEKNGNPMAMLLYGVSLLIKPSPTGDDYLKAIGYFEKVATNWYSIQLLQNLNIQDQDGNRPLSLDLALITCAEDLLLEDKKKIRGEVQDEELIKIHKDLIANYNMLDVFSKLAHSGKLLPMLAIAKYVGISRTDEVLNNFIKNKENAPNVLAYLLAQETRIQAVVSRQIQQPTEPPLFISDVDSVNVSSSIQKQLHHWSRITSNLLKPSNRSVRHVFPSEEEQKLINQNKAINDLLLESLDALHTSKFKVKNTSFKIVYDSEKNAQAAALFKTGQIRDNAQGVSVPIPLFISFISTAPWNLRIKATTQEKKRVEGAATSLIESAIYESIKKGYKGAVALESVPLAKKFYEKLGFKAAIWSSKVKSLEAMELSAEDAEILISSNRAGRASPKKFSESDSGSDSDSDRVSDADTHQVSNSDSDSDPVSDSDTSQSSDSDSDLD